MIIYDIYQSLFYYEQNPMHIFCLENVNLFLYLIIIQILLFKVMKYIYSHIMVQPSIILKMGDRLVPFRGF